MDCDNITYNMRTVRVQTWGNKILVCKKDGGRPITVVARYRPVAICSSGYLDTIHMGLHDEKTKKLN